MTAFSIARLKGQRKITELTAYDYGMAMALDEAKIDMLLVGDSMGMVVYGQPNTLGVDLEMSINHCKAVAQGAKTHSLVIGDMPFGSFGVSVDQTVANAVKMIKIGNVEAVKLEGASDRRIEEIAAIIDVGIPVQGHVGLLPQSAFKLGGNKVQGKTGSYWSEAELITAAKRLADVGCFSIVLEAIQNHVAQKITESVGVPTIGIGAGPYCDGQVLVCYDMLGYQSGYLPKFVKQYADIKSIIHKAVTDFSNEVQEGKYPSDEFSYGD